MVWIMVAVAKWSLLLGKTRSFSGGAWRVAAALMLVFRTRYSVCGRHTANQYNDMLHVGDWIVTSTIANGIVTRCVADGCEGEKLGQYG